MINIASVLVANQPGVLVRFVKSRLLSVVALRDMLGMVPPATAKADTSHTENVMRHDAYRRVRGWRIQIRRGA